MCNSGFCNILENLIFLPVYFITNDILQQHISPLCMCVYVVHTICMYVCMSLQAVLHIYSSSSVYLLLTKFLSSVPWTHSPCLWCPCGRAGHIWTSRCDWTYRSFWCCQALRLSAAHPDSLGWGLRRRSAGLEAPEVKERARESDRGKALQNKMDKNSSVTWKNMRLRTQGTRPHTRWWSVRLYVHVDNHTHTKTLHKSFIYIHVETIPC